MIARNAVRTKMLAPQMQSSVRRIGSTEKKIKMRKLSFIKFRQPTRNIWKRSGKNHLLLAESLRMSRARKISRTTP